MPESAATELAKAARQLVNAPLPVSWDGPHVDTGRVTLDTEHPFWVAARNVRATLDTYKDETGVDGEQDA